MRYEYEWAAEPNGHLCVDRGGPAQPMNPRDVPFNRGPIRRPMPPTPARPREFIEFTNARYGTDSDDMAQRIEATSAFAQTAVRRIKGPVPAAGPPSFANTNFAGIVAGLPFLPINGDPDSDFDSFHDPGVTP